MSRSKQAAGLAQSLFSDVCASTEVFALFLMYSVRERQSVCILSRAFV